MSYGDFTIDMLKEKFGIRFIEDSILFPDPGQSHIPGLSDMLKRYLPLATMMNTEKARSELIIAPVLAEFRLKNRISLFSGIEFNVAPEEGLNGRCDFIISGSEEQLVLSAPVIIIAEAKNDNIIGGIPQCVSAMVGAMKYNILRKNEIDTVYGIITTGSLWKFLKLESSNTAYIDIAEYHIHNVDNIINILDKIVSN